MGTKNAEFYGDWNPLKKLQKTHAKKVINKTGKERLSFLLLLLFVKVFGLKLVWVNFFAFFSMIRILHFVTHIEFLQAIFCCCLN